VSHRLLHRSWDYFFSLTGYVFRHNRHWRYHKEQRIWITKDGITSQSKQIPGGEAGMFHYWDADNWQRDRKEMTVLYADLEEKTRLPFAHEATLQMAASPAAAAAQQQQVPTPAQVPQRYQGVGVAAM
jgi:CCR4-NOT transcription complex subunit 2